MYSDDCIHLCFSDTDFGTLTSTVKHDKHDKHF